MSTRFPKYCFAMLMAFTALSAKAQFVSNVYWTEQTNMPATSTIYYSGSRPLQWSDFKGQPDQLSVAAAITASGFGYKADYKSNGTKAQLNIGVYCYFSKTSSWVKQGKTTPYILNHEQQHFDISFIAAGMFIQRLKTANITKDNYKTVLPQVYNECVALMNKMQNEYDGQTKNGQLKDEQAKWDALISKQVDDVTK